MTQGQSKKRVLIAEDEYAYSHALSLRLEHEGYEVECATNGIEALDQIKKNSFDLLITDIMMPNMDGFTLMSEVKKAGYNVPIIAMSNLSQEEDKKKAKDFGASRFIEKSSTSIVEVMKVIQSVLN